MPLAVGKVQIKPTIAEETKRYLEHAAESDGCAMGEVIDRLVELSKVNTLEEVTMPLTRVEDRFDRLEAMLKQQQRPSRQEETTDTVEVLDGPPAQRSTADQYTYLQYVNRRLDELPMRLRQVVEPKPQPPTPRWNRRVWRQLGLVLTVLTMSGAHLTLLVAYLAIGIGWHPDVYFACAGLSVVSLSVALGEEMLRGRA